MSDDVLRGLLLVVALVVLFPLLWMGTGLFGGGTHMGGGLFGLIPLLLVLVFGYLVYVALVDDSSERDADTALDKLRAAYARGDLSDEEFERRRERLREDR